MTSFRFLKRSRWKNYVTPKLIKKAPIHQWLVFPHSFSAELVEELVKLWGLNSDDSILDPFAGAGTTLVTAKKKNINATGFDLSPFAVFVAKAKTANYDLSSLKNTWIQIKENFRIIPHQKLKKTYPELITKALTDRILLTFEGLDETIFQYSKNKTEQIFFRLALFKIMPEFSQAKASGGWLKWVDNDINVDDFFPTYCNQINLMLRDIESFENYSPRIEISLCDARYLPIPDKKYTAVITSPPYPNRHDYTRIFGVELMYGFLDWEETRELRYQSIHSHPEAKPSRPEFNKYIPPRKLELAINKIRKKKVPNRLVSMLEGYFIDLYCCFRELKKVCASDANIAVVLGNAQYYGIPLMVDEIAADIGEQVGLNCTNIIAIRMRGNSAQQMKIFGRNPSRESVILFKA